MTPATLCFGSDTTVLRKWSLFDIKTSHTLELLIYVDRRGGHRVQFVFNYGAVRDVPRFGSRGISYVETALRLAKMQTNRFFCTEIK